MNWHKGIVGFHLLISLLGVCLLYGRVSAGADNNRIGLQDSKRVQATTLLSPRQPAVANFGRALGAGFDPLQSIFGDFSPADSTTPSSIRTTVTKITVKTKTNKRKPRRRGPGRSGTNHIRPPISIATTIATTTLRPNNKTNSQQKKLKKQSLFQQRPKDLPKSFNIHPTTDKSNQREDIEPIVRDSPILFNFEWGKELEAKSIPELTTHQDLATQPVHVTSIKTKSPPLNRDIGPYVCNVSSAEDLNARRLCGYPTFYESEKCASQFCSDAILSKCENKGSMITFGATVMLLGVFIIVANSFLPYLIYRQKCLRNRHNYVKASLAFADILKGVVVCSVVPNIFWFHSLSEKEVVEAIHDGRDSAIAVIFGSLLIASSQCSTLHLLFLTLERFAAFKSPLRHNSIRTTTICYILVGVWIISTFFSFLPVIFPHHFEYAFFPVIFVYMLSSKSLPDGSNYHGILYCCLTIILPYVIMVVVSIWTGFVVSRKLQSSPSTSPLECTSPSSPRIGFFRNRLPTLTPEFTVFKTLLIMIVAFSLTLVPVIVVILLYNVGYYHCENYAMPYTIAFYASISNSFVNVIIYTARDAKFRNALMSEISGMFRGDKTKEFSEKQRKIRIFSTTSNLP